MHELGICKTLFPDCSEVMRRPLLVPALLMLRLRLTLVLLRPFAHLAPIGRLEVEVREDEVEDFVVPRHRAALDALLDVLLRS